MSFNKNFCPSPWFHMRINNSGSYEYCRWMHIQGTRAGPNNISCQSPEDYFQNTLAPLRSQFLNGEAPDKCKTCYEMERYNKVSGRQRQLLKIGVLDQNFEKSLSSSPMIKEFDYSSENQGHTQLGVLDWQIDLGNYCNSACVFCSPESSSRLAAEFKKLKIINQVPSNSWCDDQQLVEKFISSLKNNNPRYLHFIGGETLITSGFKTILQALVDSGQSKHVTIGFTTNLTVWDEDIVNLLAEFEQINLGLSIETLTPVNSYVRWPSIFPTTIELLDRWVTTAQKHCWLVQLRITPTCLTINDLDTVYNYAWNHNLAVESCNFLYKPECLRINVLPKDILLKAKQKLSNWIESHYIEGHEQIVNTRDPNIARLQVIQDAQSYIKFIDSVDDESYRLPDLVDYLKLLESIRKNTILDYLPEYEELFRSAGY